MRVVIVDGSSLIAERIAALLSEVSREIQIVGQASDAMSGLQVVARLQPDVVVLDVRMPGGSGLDVLAALKALGSPPVVVILTNFSYPQYRKRCLDAGADFFLDKSTEFSRLPEVFRDLLDSSRRVYLNVERARARGCCSPRQGA